MTRILIDYHHPGLWKSLYITLHDRLGYDILRPVGMEWYEEGYWQHEKFWAQDRFARLFLTKTSADVPLGEPVTLAEAKEIKPEVFLATVPGNALGFSELARELGSKVGQQVGNNEHFVLWGDVDFVLDSTTTHPRPAEYTATPQIQYDQEIDPRYYNQGVQFSPSGPVSSFLNVWHRDQAGLEFFDRVAQRFPGKFMLYGENGINLRGDSEVIPAMRESSIVWNTKKIGDGWGHVLHSAMAMGKPIISVNKFYSGMSGMRMLEGNHGVIDIGGLDINEVAFKIETLLDDPDEIVRMGELNHQRFMDIIDYEGQAKKIQEVIGV